MSKEQWFKYYERRLSDFEARLERLATPEEEQWCARQADEDLMGELSAREDIAERHSPDHGLIESMAVDP